MTAAFWDRFSARYERKIRRHDDLYTRTFDAARSLLSDSAVVLDFACASGEMSLDLAPHVARIHGVDISPKMIELANAKLRSRQMANASFDRINTPDEALNSHSYSAVLAFNVLHLVADATATLAGLHDLLTPGGLLISETPCLAERGRPVRALVFLLQKLGIAPPLRSFEAHELESLVSSSGFEILETRVWEAESGIQWIVARKP